MGKRQMNILFVDDAPEILTSLQRMMRGAPWTVRFAEGGVEALDMLEEFPCDVVVTDLNMPEINGIKLLKVIQKKYPHLIRIIYSGNLTKDSVREVAAYTHRFIAKPCTIEKMMQAIENTVFIHNVLDNERIKEVLTNTGSLPSLPHIYTQLMAEIDKPDFSLKDAIRLISSDIGMSVNILKQINLLGHSHDIVSIEQATTLLGLDAIKAIVLTSHIFSSMNITTTSDFSAEQLTRHSMLVARFAQEIVLLENGDRKQAESAYVAGVLHDLGILLLAQNFPETYDDVLERVFTASRPLADVERNLIGISHGEIGAYLLALWGFTREILVAVAYHEYPQKRSVKGFDTLAAVYFASYYAHKFEKDLPVDSRAVVESTYLDQLGCRERFAVWEDHCRRIYDTTAAYSIDA